MLYSVERGRGAVQKIVCEECGKHYDYQKDDFCPRCGAFNPPRRTWGVDPKGDVIRVDGINEENHAGSFVHREVHQERSQRREKGLDWKQGAAPAQKKRAAQPLPKAPVRPSPRSNAGQQSLGKVIALIVGIIFLVNFIIPLLTILFGAF